MYATISRLYVEDVRAHMKALPMYAEAQELFGKGFEMYAVEALLYEGRIG